MQEDERLRIQKMLGTSSNSNSTWIIISVVIVLLAISGFFIYRKIKAKKNG